MDVLSSWVRGVKFKLLSLIFLFIISLLVIEIFSITTLKQQAKDEQMLANNRLPKITTLLKLRINAEAAVRFLWAATGFEKLEIRKNKLQNAELKFHKFEEEFRSFVNLKPSPEVATTMEEMFKNWKRVESMSLQVQEHLLKMDPGEDKTAKQLMEEELIPLYLKQIESISKVEKIIEQQVQETITKNEENAKSAEVLLLSIGVGIVFLLLVIGIVIARNLTNSLGAVSIQVNEAGLQVNSASNQLSTASQSLSTGAVQSASSMQETVSSLEELSSIVKLNADHAIQAASLAKQSTQIASEGEEEIKTLISAMTEIKQSSQKIEEIINVIDDIAFQTNLLSLNAAVEAARAGEQGKGFAVVADAVRSLAQRSAMAAKDINSLIKEATQKSIHGAEIADQSGMVLGEIVISVKKVSELNSEIASASSEQATAIEQINKVMNEMDTATQKNAASAEEVAASSVQLSAQAGALQKLVGDLNSIVLGGRV